MNDDLKTMFGPTPASFSRAVRRALADAPVSRRQPLRVTLIAAVLVLLATGAYAITSHLGLLSAFVSARRSYPSTVQQAIVTAEPQAVSIGPLTFTLTETLADPYVTYAACTIERTGQADCLITYYEPGSTVHLADRKLPACEYTRLGLPEGVTYLEAAQATGLRVYVVNAELDLPTEAMQLPGLPTIAWDAEGSALLTAHHVVKERDPEHPEVTLNLSVHVMNPTSGQLYHTLDETASITFTPTISGTIATRTYHPLGSAIVGDMVVQSVLAEQTACGIYFTLTSQGTGEEAPPRSQWNQLLLCPVQENNKRLALSISSMARVTVDSWPAITSWYPTALDAFPDTLRVTDYLKKTGDFVFLE